MMETGVREENKGMVSTNTGMEMFMRANGGATCATVTESTSEKLVIRLLAHGT